MGTPTNTADSVGHVIWIDVKLLLLRLLSISSCEDYAVLADPFALSAFTFVLFRLNISVANDLVRTIAIVIAFDDSIEEECLRL